MRKLSGAIKEGSIGGIEISGREITEGIQPFSGHLTLFTQSSLYP
jgi:hypothetical protein